MAVTFQYRCAFTGLSLTGVVYRDSLGDAAGTALTFTENTSRLGVYTASATVTAGPAFVRIAGDLADGIDVIIPADGGTLEFGANQSPLAVGDDGSVDVDTDAIADALSEALGGVEPTFISAFSQDGSRLTIVRGNDYAAANDSSLEFSITGRTELIGTAAKLQLPGLDADIVASPSISSGTQTITFGDLLAVNTLLMTASKQPQPYTVDFVTAGGLRRSYIEGLVYVKDPVGE